ncbi:tannase/feruloyl esterase family alpha/beta hydrolase [Actinoplanes palleronii]|uniref:Tannase n=1 Tax=Actinoplanes palleronii TaxID=113570 RepID=A0ABQ4BG41_9ACTN|nr:tannase/feruloyl esterase family alpha/beta hydrolase [Actinoplanes palleronii]GIE69567.1 tannase [Actinoplanes palleronii]
MRRRLLLIAAAIVPLSAAALAPMAANALNRAESASTSCRTLPVSAPAGTRVASVTAVARPGGSVTIPDQTPLPTPAEPITGVPAWCDVTVTLTHPGANDHVTVKVLLPTDPKNWTGRLQATGGSAYQAGNLDGPELVTAVKNGYVGTATDAGVSDNPLDTSWALKADGTANTALVTNFASRSLHDMTVVAKSVTTSFYGKPADYSYWNGCSTGGRQGYLEAQRYPDDYDGVLANAPAVNWDRFAIATLWPQVVYNEEKVALTGCELTAFNNAAVQACDTDDGVKDTIIGDPQTCRWDPRRLVGATVECEGQTLTITKAKADVMRKIWAGPVAPNGKKLWYGPNKGADLSFYLAKAGQPFFVADFWAKYFVTRNLSLDTTKLTYTSFAKLFASSQRQFNHVIGTDDADLRAFRNSGGKLLTWQGQYDELVPTQGTVDYRERVERLLGGKAKVDRFYRLFLLPGVAHCGGGTGQQPGDALGALVKWVEMGKAPTSVY